MALNFFRQRDIDLMDPNDIPEEFINYFRSLPDKRKAEIISSRPDLAPNLGYSSGKEAAEEEETIVFESAETGEDGSYTDAETETEKESEDSDVPEILLQIRNNRYNGLNLQQILKDDMQPLEILTVPDGGSKCILHKCNFETRQLRYHVEGYSTYSVKVKLCPECNRIYLEDSQIEYVHDAFVKRNIPHTFYDLDLTSYYLRSQMGAYVLGSDEKVFVPDVWVEDDPTCPIHETELYEIECEKEYSGRKISFTAFFCEECQKVLVRNAAVSNLIDECAMNGIPEIEFESLIKKLPEKKPVPKKEIRPDFYIKEGKKQKYEDSYVADCFKLTEDDTVIVSDSIYCNLDGHYTKEVLALISILERKADRKAYLFMVGYCAECQKYYMDEVDYKAVYNLGRPEVTILRDLINDTYQITSGEVFNIEKAHLNNLEQIITDEIADIKNQPDFVEQWAVGAYDDGNLKFAKNQSKTKYKDKLEELATYCPKPYSYRVDISADGHTETYYLGHTDINLKDGKQVIALEDDFGAKLVHLNTTNIQKDGKEYHIKLSRQFDIQNATLFGYSNIRTDDDIIFRSGLTDPRLIRLLNMRKKQHKLIDIYVTIQEDQNAIVDADFDENIVVQGCAGSGKTMVLLHRLSSLQYKNKYFDFDKHALILTPNDQFNLHIKALAEGLRLTSVQRESVEQYYSRVLLGYSAEFKPDNKLVSEALVQQGYVDYIYSDQFKIDLDTAYQDIILERNKLIDRFYDLCDITGVSRREFDLSEDYRFQEQMKIALMSLDSIAVKQETDLERAKKKIADIREKKDTLALKIPVTEDLINNTIRDSIPRVYTKIGIYMANQKTLIEEIELEQEQLIKTRDSVKNSLLKLRKRETLRELDIKINIGREKLLSMLNKRGDDNIIFSANLEGKSEEELLLWMRDVSALIKEVEEEIRLCENTKNQLENYRTENMSLSNELMLAEKTLEELKAKMFSDEVIKGIKDLSSEALQYNVIGTYRRVFDKATLNYKEANNIKKIVGKCHRYDLYAELLFAKKFFNTINGSVQYMCVDEGQDLALNEYRLISELNQKNMTFNIFGDTNQLMKMNRGISDWAIFNEEFNAKTYTLNANYRNTNQSTRFCNRSFDMNVLETGADGKKVHEIARVDLEKDLAALNISTERIAILLPRVARKKNYLHQDELPENINDIIGDEIGNGLIAVLYVDEAKGIEFEKVYVIANRMSRNEKYIAYTRALSELVIVVDEALDKQEENKSKSLPKNKSKGSKNKPHHPFDTLTWTDSKQEDAKEDEFKEVSVIDQNTKNEDAPINEVQEILLEESAKAVDKMQDCKMKEVPVKEDDAILDEAIEKVKTEISEVQSKAAITELGMTEGYLTLKTFAGASLGGGNYVELAFSDADIADSIDYLFGTKCKRDTTYKFAFFKSILDLIDESSKEYKLNFDQIFCRFTEIYWPLVVNHLLYQKINAEKNLSYVEQILCETVDRYGLDFESEFNELSKAQQRKVVKDVKEKCKLNVIGAVYGDTKGMMYSFSRKEEWIELNPCVYRYLMKNEAMLQGKNYTAWADFLEKTNGERSADDQSYLQELKDIFE